MRIRSLLLGSMAAAGLAMALAIAPASAYDIVSAGPSIDGQLYIGEPIVDYTLVNPAADSKLHGSGLVDLDSINLVAMNDSATDPALAGVWSDNVFTVKHGLGVPLGYGIDVIPAALDIAMVKNHDVCIALGGSGGILATSAGYNLDGTALIGKVFGPDGWTSPTAIPTTGGCAVSAPAGDGSLAVG